MDISKYVLKHVRKADVIKANNFKDARIPKELDNDLAYFIGILRDGIVSARAGKKGDYSIEIYQKNKKWLETVIKPLIKKLFNLNVKVSFQMHGKYKTYRVRIYSKIVYTFIKKLFEHPDTNGQKTCWKTPSLILKAGKRIQRHYIQGFFDAEGYIGNGRNLIIIGQAWDKKGKSPLTDISNMLKDFGIERCYLYRIIDKRPNRKPLERLQISNKKDVKNFISEISSRHPEKLKRF